MHVVVVEDEAMVAQRLLRLIENEISDELQVIKHFDDLEVALDYLQKTPIDLLFLDLNLHGKDGFEILANTVSQAYHTIVVSAYAQRALEAFEYGVLDFVPKPFSAARLKKAISRFTSQEAGSQTQTRHLSIRQAGELKLVDINDIHYIQGADNYSELVMKNRQTMLHDKSLTRLMMVLPDRFQRIHKSYIIDLNQTTSIHAKPGSQYHVKLDSGQELPVGRTRYKDLKALFI